MEMGEKANSTLPQEIRRTMGIMRIKSEDNYYVHKILHSNMTHLMNGLHGLRYHKQTQLT